jgi:hypothetical protein
MRQSLQFFDSAIWYISMYIYDIYMYVYIYIYLWIYICINIYIYINKYIYTYIHIYIYIYFFQLSLGRWGSLSNFLTRPGTDFWTIRASFRPWLSSIWVGYCLSAFIYTYIYMYINIRVHRYLYKYTYIYGLLNYQGFFQAMTKFTLGIYMCVSICVYIGVYILF